MKQSVQINFMLLKMQMDRRVLAGKGSIFMFPSANLC
jgi:hypothetical protein